MDMAFRNESFYYMNLVGRFVKFSVKVFYDTRFQYLSFFAIDKY